MEMITRRRHTNYRLDEPLLPTTAPYKQPTIPWSHNVPSSPPNPTLVPQHKSCRDRTNEFLSAVRSLQPRRNNHSIPVQKNRPQKNEFTLKARCIGKDLANTVCKLEKLTLLVCQRTSDNPSEFGELTAMIKQDITGLNKQIEGLSEVAKIMRYYRTNHQQAHANSIVFILQSRLATMSNDFKVVLETRAENLRQQKHLPSPQLYRRADDYLRKDAYMQEDQQEDLVINIDSTEPQKQQNQVLLEEQSHYQERSTTMQSIETTIVELGSVFQRLASIVKEQEEQIGRIDSNISEADMNIDAAHTELLKYLQYVSSNRWLLIKIFIVLMIFFIVFIKFLA